LLSQGLLGDVQQWLIKFETVAANRLGKTFFNEMAHASRYSKIGSEGD